MRGFGKDINTKPVLNWACCNDLIFPCVFFLRPVAWVHSEEGLALLSYFWKRALISIQVAVTHAVYTHGQCWKISGYSMLNSFVIQHWTSCYKCHIYLLWYLLCNDWHMLWGSENCPLYRLEGSPQHPQLSFQKQTRRHFWMLPMLYLSNSWEKYQWIFN